jgi:hypothetical protein
LEYYPALKRNEVLRHAPIRKNLKNIMPSERSQVVRPHTGWFSMKEIPRMNKSIQTEDMEVVARV